MKHLAIIIEKAYPEKLFSLKEQYDKTPNGDIKVVYEVWIEGRESEYFVKFDDLESFVYSLAQRRIIGDAQDIARGINPYKNIPVEEEDRD